MSRYSIVAIANQKGGVGKTTTEINLGAALAMAGHRTILVDLDPQGNASTGLGIDEDRRQLTVYDLLAGEESLQDCAIPTQIDNLHIVPATADLSSADVDLSQTQDRTRLLTANFSPGSGLADRTLTTFLWERCSTYWEP